MNVQWLAKKMKIQNKNFQNVQKNIKESKDSLSRNYWNKQNIYVTTQWRNIRERCVIFKRMIYDYNGWNLPNCFRYYNIKKCDYSVTFKRNNQFITIVVEICQIISILQNNISKIHMLKLLKYQKILRNLIENN